MYAQGDGVRIWHHFEIVRILHLDVVDRCLRRMGYKTIPDEAPKIPDEAGIVLNPFRRRYRSTAIKVLYAEMINVSWLSHRPLPNKEVVALWRRKGRFCGSKYRMPSTKTPVVKTLSRGSLYP